MQKRAQSKVYGSKPLRIVFGGEIGSLQRCLILIMGQRKLSFLLNLCKFTFLHAKAQRKIREHRNRTASLQAHYQHLLPTLPGVTGIQKTSTRNFNVCKDPYHLLDSHAQLFKAVPGDFRIDLLAFLNPHGRSFFRQTSTMSNYQTTNFNNSFTVMADGAGALTDCCSESHRHLSNSTPVRRQYSKQNGSSDGATRLVGYGRSSSRLNLEYAGNPLPFAHPSYHDACQPTHAVPLKRSTTRANTEEEFCHELIRPELGGSTTRTPAMPYTPPSAEDVDERQQQYMNIPRRRGRLVRRAAVQAQAFLSAAINEGVLVEEMEHERGEDCRRRPVEDAKTTSSTPSCEKVGPTEEEWGALDGSNVEEEEDEDEDGVRWPLAKRCKMTKPLTSR